MTGLSKYFSKYTSLCLLAAAVLCFGLMMTACSEGDDTPAVVDYDANGTKLDVIVGLEEAAADEEDAEKGIDVPANAFNMVVSLIAGDEYAIERSFVAPGSELDGAAFWKNLDGNKVMMSSSISEEDIAEAGLDSIGDITAVAVMVYDKDGILVGALCDDDVTLVEGGKNTVDFTAADAPAFKDKAALLADSSLRLTTDPEAEDGVVTIAVGENVTVTAAAVTALSEATSIAVDVDPEDLVLSVAAETTALTVEGNVVTGAEATDEAVEVAVVYTDPDDEASVIEASFSVTVEGDETGDETGESGDETGESGDETGESGDETGESGDETGESGDETGESGEELTVGSVAVDPQSATFPPGETHDVWFRVIVYDADGERIDPEKVAMTFKFFNEAGEEDTSGGWFTMGTIEDDHAFSPSQDTPYGVYSVKAFAEGYEGSAETTFEMIKAEE